MEEVFRSFYETVTQRHIRFLLRLFSWVLLGELWGHEDVLDDRTQDMRIKIIGSGNEHDRREKTVDAAAEGPRPRVVRKASQGQGPASAVTARLGLARLGLARLGSAQLSSARLGSCSAQGLLDQIGMS